MKENDKGSFDLQGKIRIFHRDVDLIRRGIYQSLTTKGLMLT